MEIIKYEHRLEYNTLNILKRYIQNSSLCVFDIETLGLNPSINEIVLAGLLTVQPDGVCQLTQYFLDTPDDEAALLEQLKEELNKYDILLTYNGRHFDIPFIKKRASLLNIDNYEIHPYNLDLYLIINGHSPFRNFLPSLKQSSIEDYMGLGVDRKDEISGKESIKLYYDFLLCSDTEKKSLLKEKILLHNHDDLMQLYRILPIIKQTDLHKAMNTLGFPIKGINGWPSLNILSSKIVSGKLKIEGSYCGKSINYISYETELEPFSCTFGADKKFTFSFPIEKIKNNVFINAAALLGAENNCSQYGGYVNGFLILIEDDKRNFLEINMISKKLLEKFMLEHIM